MLNPIGSNGIYQSGNTASLTIIVDGLESNEGNVRVAIFENAKSFPNGKPFKAQAISADNSASVELIFENIPYGDYAVAVYHDTNTNDELDTNFMGIPKEAYGFSNDHRPKFSGPDYESAKVKINQAQVKLNITVEEF
ncbi:DUF2141 domain-containing protein [Catalinimonas sp. 4WD22]|uniref:DUF2141 domain-containing protein n=1 Tax=Catalinimonas locisalis TaxID=3133978 RepID=UPI0031019B37